MKRTPMKRGNGFSSKKKKRINNTSSKERSRKRDKNKAYEEIWLERSHVCEGCGSASNPLSRSHLIPVGFNKSLEANKENIRLHCITFLNNKGCHEKWEDGVLGEIDLMLDFEKNLQIIEKLDVSYSKIKKGSIYG